MDFLGDIIGRLNQKIIAFSLITDLTYLLKAPHRQTQCFYETDEQNRAMLVLLFERKFSFCTFTRRYSPGIFPPRICCIGAGVAGEPGNPRRVGSPSGGLQGRHGWMCFTVIFEGKRFAGWDGCGQRAAYPKAGGSGVKLSASVGGNP